MEDVPDFLHLKLCKTYTTFHSVFSHCGRANKLSLLIWLNESVGFHPTFSRHAKAHASMALVSWLNENVGL